MIKKLLLLLTVVSTIFISGCGEVHMGYMNVDKISETPQMKAIQDEAENKIKEAQEQALKDLEAKKDATDEEKQQVQMEVQRKLMGLQQAYSSQLEQKLNSVLADIVKSKNIDVVINSSESQQMIFEGGIDLTDEVVQKLQ